MIDTPWLTIMGMGEDGGAGLATVCQEALRCAEVILGPERHLKLLPVGLSAETLTWPIPFADGLPLLDGLRGRQTVVLVSGDPFWFGAGSVIARHLPPGEWHALPGPSTFSLVAAHLGWPLERTVCLGLHAAPLTRLRPYLSAGQRIITLLRDGEAVSDLAAYLNDSDFGCTELTVCEAMGGPNETVTRATADALPDRDFRHPVAVALAIAGTGASLPLSPGRPDSFFDHDGQITKSPVRAMTLAALAPRAGEHLWDIGGGSGSIAIEWALAHPSMRATAFEQVPARSARIETNARMLGCDDRITIITGAAPDVLAHAPEPQAVFIGGGLCDDLVGFLTRELPEGTRLVVNGVTLEAESLLARCLRDVGGDLLRLEIARAEPLGAKTGWKATYPIVQWSVTL